MRTLIKTTPCPWCGTPAVVTLTDELDEGYGAVFTGRPALEFRCVTPSHTLPEPQMLRLWARDRFSDYAGRPRSGAPESVGGWVPERPSLDSTVDAR